MMQLYDIAQEGLVIGDLLTESEGELTPELEKRLDDLLRAGTDKLEAAERVCRNLDANAKACAEEGKRLMERAKSFERQRKSLRARMAAALECAFGGKIKTPLFTIWCQRSAATMRVVLSAGVSMDELRARRPDLFKVEYIFDEATVKAEHVQDHQLPAEITVEDVPGTLFCRTR
jgi:hypothetical protein